MVVVIKREELLSIALVPCLSFPSGARRVKDMPWQNYKGNIFDDHAVAARGLLSRISSALPLADKQLAFRAAPVIANKFGRTREPVGSKKGSGLSCSRCRVVCLEGQLQRADDWACRNHNGIDCVALFMFPFHWRRSRVLLLLSLALAGEAVERLRTQLTNPGMACSRKRKEKAVSQDLSSSFLPS